MKRILIVGMLLAGAWARGDVILSQSFSGGTVAQGNPVGSTFTGNFTAAGAGNLVLGITVGLNVSGGYSGGFYIYLVGPDGSTAVTLLNTPTTATPLGASFNITLSGAGSAITSSTDFSSSSGPYLPSGSLSALTGQTANGNWTLYFADLASGGGNPTLNNWTLNIDVVPEPIAYGLAVFGLVFGGVGFGRFYLGRRRSSSVS